MFLSRSELGEAFEVLGGCGEEEFFGGSFKASEPEASKTEVSFEMGEEHLHLLSFSP